MPKTLTDLDNTIRQTFEIQADFHIQFMGPDFNNGFMNVTSVQDIQDRSAMMLVYMVDLLGSMHTHNMAMLLYIAGVVCLHVARPCRAYNLLQVWRTHKGA